jgi:hypothetical protein
MIGNMKENSALRGKMRPHSQADERWTIQAGFRRAAIFAD